MTKVLWALGIVMTIGMGLESQVNVFNETWEYFRLAFAGGYAYWQAGGAMITDIAFGRKMYLEAWANEKIGT